MTKARDIASAAPAPSTVSATEIGYLDGVTSAIQTQINSKIGQSTAINPTIVDAKGDIIAATAADTVARLAVGSNDQVLTADSSTATGLKWATASSGGMTLLSTTTLSGTSTTISNINQTYKDLFIIVTGATNTVSDGYRYIRPNNSSGIAIQAVAYPSSSVSAETDIYIPRDGSTTYTDSDNAAICHIYNYASTTTNKPFIGSISYAQTGTGHRGQVFGGSIKTNTAITSLVFVQTGGGSFNAGTVKIYGVN